MKYAYKLAICIILLLAAVLSIGGYWFLYEDFSRELTQTKEQNVSSHLRDKYALETAILKYNPDSDENEFYDYIYLFAADFTFYNNTSGVSFALFSMGEPQLTKAIYSNIPTHISRETQLEQVAQGEQSLRIKKINNTDYMLMASPVAGTDNLSYFSCFDVSSLFNMRSVQLTRFIQIEIVAIVILAIAALALSLLITLPIKKLTIASKQIAQGAYDMHTNIRSNDEIGELSRNFDTMAKAVASQISSLNLSIQQRDSFVSAFTHEIKTPMTSILGYSDLLRSGKYSHAEHQMGLDYIFNESRRLETLSQKLLALMKLSDECDISLVPVSLQSVLDIFTSSMPENRHRISLSYTDQLVLADTELLADLLRNLTINALKASGEEKLVKINAVSANGQVIITVADTGCGISPEDLPHITQPFYMADKSRARAQNGSGMGLALGEKIAQLHGTTLQFNSVLGAGTTVSFCLKEAQA